MRARAALLFVLTSILIAGKRPAQGTGEAENAAVSIVATASADVATVSQVLGGPDLGGHYVVLQIRLTPKDPKPYTVDRDDFVLKTDKDGERTHPFAPSQIAGDGALIISEQKMSHQSPGTESNGPIWGGMPGTGSRPQRMPGNGGGIGSMQGVSEAKATAKSSTKDAINPLIATLEKRELAQKPVSETVTGLLYFPLEKQRLKDLELLCATPAGKLTLRFK